MPSKKGPLKKKEEFTNQQIKKGNSQNSTKSFTRKKESSGFSPRGVLQEQDLPEKMFFHNYNNAEVSEKEMRYSIKRNIENRQLSTDKWRGCPQRYDQGLFRMETKRDTKTIMENIQNPCVMNERDHRSG